MEQIASSTIAALCYAREREFDLAPVTGELAGALGAVGAGTVTVNTPYDDLVFFDLPGVRVALMRADLATEFGGPSADVPYPGCLMVAVGAAPGYMPNGPLYENRAALARRLADRVERWYDADDLVEFDRNGPVDAMSCDRAVDELCRTLKEDEAEPAPEIAGAPAFETMMYELTTTAEQRGAPLPPLVLRGPGAPAAPFLQPPPLITVGPASPRVEGGAHALAPIVTDELLAAFDARFEVEQANRNGALLPTHPAMMADSVAAAAAAKAAADAQDETIYEDVETAPLLRRAAIHGLNAAVMSFSLPVGAALLTLAVLGRESLIVSARTTALTGAAMGISQTSILSQLIHHFT